LKKEQEYGISKEVEIKGGAAICPSSILKIYFLLLLQRKNSI
jgi:hypothetical protein